MKVLTILTLLPQVLNMVRFLMDFAESAFGGGGTGELKKAFVLEAVRSFIGAMAGLSTGGQKDTWSALHENSDLVESTLGSLVDFLAGLLFPKNSGGDV